MKFVVIEFHTGHETCVFGPFDTEREACGFTNNRIATLADAWKNSSVVTSKISWQVKQLFESS